MSPFFENLGIGALFAAVALPMLAAAVGDVSGKDPRSRHGVLLWPLVLAASLFAVPWLREAFRFGGEVAVVPAVLSKLTAPPVNDVGEASHWSVTGAVGALFLALMCAAGLRHLLQWARLQRVLWRAAVASKSLRLEVERQALRLGVAAPEVLVSAHTAVPFVVGALRSRLVWPAKLLERLSEEERQLVVLHELTHLARGDHRLAPMLALLQLAFPFHPTAARLMRELAVAREEAVDARIAPEHVHAYAQLLVTVTAFANQGPRLEVLGMADASLKRRIAALASDAPKPLARFARVTVMGLATIAALIVAPRAVAQSARSQVSIEVGMQTVISVPGVARVAASTDELVEVQMLGGEQLVITGIHPGKGALRIWLKSGEQRTVEVEVTGSPNEPQPKVANGENISLKVGGVKIITIDGAIRVAVGDPGVCDVTTHPNEKLELRGVAKGRTSLLVWTAGGARHSMLITVE